MATTKSAGGFPAVERLAASTREGLQSAVIARCKNSGSSLPRTERR
jgi:hypothetical protein